MRVSVAALLLAAVFSLTAHAGSGDRRSTDVPVGAAKAAPDELLVRFAPGRAREGLAALEAQSGMQVVSSRRFRLINWYHVRVKGALSLTDTMRAFRASADVLDVEPNYAVHALATTPNDPMYGSQWGLPQIGAPDAWDVQTESDVLVAVIDTGVQYTHPDLAANIWVNPGEVPGDGLDNDFNGFVDDVYGWDFYDNDSDPMDTEGHGTHVAGTIAAVTNNSVGVAGVCWTAQIMCLRFLGPGGGHVVDAIDAIEYATLNGALVMNNSWGGGGHSRALRDAIWVADGFGALFIAAAGNNGTNNDATPVYPSNYDLKNMISVAASGPDDALWGAEPVGSNWGLTTVHLAAPGQGILSTFPGGYASMSGTSMAAPHVAGACALVWSRYPGLTHHQVKDLILDTVDLPNVEEPDDDPETENPLVGLLITEGRLNVFAALTDLRIVTPSPLPKWETDAAYSSTIEAVGGVGSYTWALVEPPEDFPLTINAATGELTGTPEVEEPTTYQFAVRVTDSSVPTPVSVEKDFQITIETGYNLVVQSSPFSNVEIKGPDYGITEYTRTYPRPDPIMEYADLIAPAKWAGYYFYQWTEDSSPYSFNRSTGVTMDSSKTLTAVYDPLKSFYVNDETPENGIAAGNDANPGTSPGAPKRHVQAMLDDVAVGAYACHEWRIIVSAGTYDENVMLGPQHAGLTIQGLGWETSVIDGGGGGPCIHADRWTRGTIVDLMITNGAGIGGGGGILLSNGSSATIIRNRIVGNTAAEGAGIACYSGTVTVKDNYIEDNTADDEGGAVLLVESNAVMIEGNAINGNVAPLGAGIRCWLATGWITNNNIADNVAAGGYGGGIYATGSGMQIDQNKITGNSAARGGGILCWACTQPIELNVISDNVATAAGGGISFEYFSTHNVEYNQITGNTALYGGGVFFTESESLSFIANDVSYNTATGSGGGIFLSGGLSPVIGTPDLTGQNFICDNVAARDGGGVYVSGGGSPQIGLPTPEPWPYSNYMFLNEAGRNGGGIYCAQGSSPVILNNDLSECSATSGGGIYCSSAEAQIGNGAIDGWNGIISNVANALGGGVYITGELMPTLNFNGYGFNTAVEGGGIYLDEGTSPHILGGALFGNEADYGAGLRCPAASPSITGIFEVISNDAAVAGGGIYVTDESMLALEGCYMAANTAPEGAGLYVIDSSAQVVRSTLTAHTCVAAGAAVRALNSDLVMDNSVILSNSVPAGQGGGIYVAEGTTLTMNGTTIQGNSAAQGGGIYVADAAVSVISEGDFNNAMDNTATLGAGVYCAEEGSVTLGMVRFGESYAQQGAGVYCAAGSTPTIENCYFVGNSAAEGAGVFCAGDALPVLKNLTMVANVATDGAAGVHSENPDVTLRNAIFWINNVDLFGCSPTYSCISSPPPGTGNFGGDPLLVGPAYTGNWPESPSEEYVGGFWIPSGVTLFTDVPGVGRDQFVGMWLNPNIQAGNTQFLIVEDFISESGPTICVKGRATSIAEEGGTFCIWDYHPKSTAGHWTGQGWTSDDVTSPCVDAGDPADDYANEPENNGNRINMGACGNTYQASISAAYVPYLVAEQGIASADHNWMAVNLTEDFVDPIVVGSPATSVGLQPGVVRVRNVTNTSFEIRFQEWDYLDGGHSAEQIHWIAVERGVHDLLGGLQLVADSFTTSNANVYSPLAVDFPEPFDDVPVVVAQVMTYNSAEAVVDRICGVTAEGMDFAMQEEESSDATHVSETIGYLAVSQGQTAIGTVPIDARRTPALATHDPLILTSTQGNVMVRVEEEQSSDTEVEHAAPERIGLIGIAGQPPVVADMQTCNGSDPCSLRVTLLSQTFQMEHGTVSADGDWTVVPLTNTYCDPVVLAGPATYKGADPGVVRVRNVTGTSFDVRFQEWNYLDGLHATEDLHYMVVERGVWQLDGNKVLVADEKPTSNDNIYAPTQVLLPIVLDAVPVIVATQQTANDADAVTERLSGIQADRFWVALQEEEAGGGHGEETVGYVAIGAGWAGPDAGVGITTDSAQTTGGAAALTDWNILVVEEQSADTETAHAEEVIGWFEFTPSASLPYFVADMQTALGSDPASLRCTQVGGGSAGCALTVTAEDKSGAELEGVEIVVARSGAGRRARLTVLETPLELTCSAGDSVKLNAPASMLDGGALFRFHHWVVDSEALTPGETTAKIEITGNHHAVAVYTRVDLKRFRH